MQRISRENVDMSKTGSNVAPDRPGTGGPGARDQGYSHRHGYTVPILEKGTEGDTAIRAPTCGGSRTSPTSSA